MRSVLTVLFLASSAMAAVITGTVRDPAGQLVAGATVRFEAGSETKTGEDGVFHLEAPGTGEHQIIAELDGFVSVYQLVNVAGDLNIGLHFSQLAPSVQSTTVVADVSSGDILNPDPGQRFFIRDEMLDANPGRPGASRRRSISLPEWLGIMANRSPNSFKWEAIWFPTT
jgi:Carboxypeptidase regulatory-like domain